MSYIDKAIAEFIVESIDYIDQLDHDLVALEQSPESREILDRVFRAIHTMKGTSSFLGYKTIQNISHTSENLLHKLRDGTLKTTPTIIETLLKTLDTLRQLVKLVETTKTDGENTFPDLIAEIAAHLTTEATETKQDHQNSGSAPSPTNEVSTIQQPTAAEHPPAEAEAKTATQMADATIRVEVELLDSLMNMVGELVLTRNQVLQYVGQRNETELANTTQRLNHITSDLQSQVLRTRMQPIGTVWEKLPRLVRDVSMSCKKRVEVEMLGKDTEIDKSLLEIIAEPLNCIVRSAIQNGIEEPDKRSAKGKAAHGTLTLNAFQDNGQVIIEVKDDGRGIDSAVIKQNAIKRNILTAEQAERLTQYELINLIFHPEFTSSNEKKGGKKTRGLDFVRNSIQRVGGTVDIETEVGQGTNTRFRIPLTLAIVPASIVVADNQTFAIPQTNIVEFIALDNDKGQAIELFHNSPVYRLRGELLPIIFLNRILNVGNVEDRNLHSKNVVVLKVGDLRFGLVVDEIRDSLEIVVKPLSSLIKDYGCYAGATVLGDGSVALIVDVFRLTNLIELESRHRRQGLVGEVSTNTATAAGTNSYVLCSAEGRSFAIPLTGISNFYEVSRGAIETAGGHTAIQYRDTIMPVIDFGNTVKRKSLQEIPVVVVKHKDKEYGILVEKISDIVNSSGEIIELANEPQLCGSTIINERITDILSVQKIIEQTFG